MAIESVLYLKRELDETLVNSMLDYLHDNLTGVVEEASRDKMIDAILNEWTDRMTPMYTIIIDDEIELMLSNWQTNRFARPKIAGGRRQLMMTFIGRELESSLYCHLIDNPDIAYRVGEVYSTIASKMAAFVGIIGDERLLEYSDELDGLDYLSHIYGSAREFSSVYLDNKLASSIGIPNLRKWASVMYRVGDDGYFVSKKKVPVIAGLSSDPWKDYFYFDHIAPILIRRIWEELSVLEFK